MPALPHTTIRNLENALASLDIAVKRLEEVRSRLGYTIDPLIERRLNEMDAALLAAQHYTSAELVTGRRVER